MMRFTEEKAKEIKDRFGISDNTIKQWRHRKTIPNAYVTGKKTDFVRVGQNRAPGLENALCSGFFSIREIERNCGFKKLKIYNWIEDESLVVLPSKSDYGCIKKYLAGMRKKIDAVNFDKLKTNEEVNSFLAVFDSKLFIWSKIFPSRTYYNAIQKDRKNGKFPVRHLQVYKESFEEISKLLTLE